MRVIIEDLIDNIAYKKAKIDRSPKAIDITDQQLMIRLGLHPPMVNIDRNVFKKTDKEKAEIANAKARLKKLNK